MGAHSRVTHIRTLAVTQPLFKITPETYSQHTRCVSLKYKKLIREPAPDQLASVGLLYIRLLAQIRFEVEIF